MRQEVYKEKGKHCAFTDIIHFGGYYWLTFRVGKEHMFSKSKIVVMRSFDGVDWEHYTETKWMNDVRDPRFYIHRKRLYVIINRIKTEGWLKKRVKISCSILWDIRKGTTMLFDPSFVCFTRGKGFFG